MLDFLIIGQGIAGSCLSAVFNQQKIKHLVINHPRASVASKIASGLINPVTGRRILLSADQDTIHPIAKQFYLEMESLLGLPLIKEKSIQRIFENIQEQNDFSLKCLEENYKPFLTEQYDRPLAEFINNELGYGTIHNCLKVNVSLFLEGYRNLLQKNNQLIEEEFDFTTLQFMEDTVLYNQLVARKIIFCEGAAVQNNPFFQYNFLSLSKGERILIRCKKLDPNQILKKGIFVTPIDQDIYWIGSTYVWNDHSHSISLGNKNKLIDKLDKLIHCDYEVLDMDSAVRPTVKDRKPLIGWHHEHPAIGIFNGMGTKGISLAPYLAKRWATNILEVPAAFNWQRYLNKV